MQWAEIQLILCSGKGHGSCFTRLHGVQSWQPLYPAAKSSYPTRRTAPTAVFFTKRPELPLYLDFP